MGVGLVSIYMYIQAGGGVVIMWVKVFDPAIVANILTVNSGTVKHVEKFLNTPPNLNATPTNFTGNQKQDKKDQLKCLRQNGELHIHNWSYIHSCSSSKRVEALGERKFWDIVGILP